MHEDHEERTDLIAFAIITTVVFILLIQSFFTTIQKAMAGPYKCEQYDGQFMSCVQAQRAGEGCFWYADCNACVRDGDDINNRCIK